MICELWTLVYEIISQVFMTKQIHINTCPIMNTFGVMAILNL